MDPRRVADEALQECARGRDTRVASARVLPVRHLAPHGLRVHIEQRHRPNRFTGDVACDTELIDQLVVVAQGGGGPGAECDHGRTGQRRDIDHCIGLITLEREIERIRHDEPTFSIRVDDFDRLARARRDDVTRSIGHMARHILCRGENANDMNRQVEQGDRAHRAKHRRRPGHVVFHLEHAARRLE